MRKCPSCRIYTLKDKCPTCRSDTLTPKSARFSPQDSYGKYRRRMKREMGGYVN